MLFLRRRILLSRISAVAVVISAIAPTATAQSPLGRKVEMFQLEDFRGGADELADFRDSKLVVLAFLGIECPLAKRYAARLGLLADEYAPRGVS